MLLNGVNVPIGRVEVLNHGYIQLIETWGSDERIIESARMSTQGSFKGWGTPEAPGDEKLLRYMWTHKHLSPFEFCGATFEVQAPIFVFREWHRHRTFSYSEMSARYAPLPNVNYLPTVERLMINTKDGNKQAGAVKGADVLTDAQAVTFQNVLQHTYDCADIFYQGALLSGVPKELARCLLPVGRYSRMRVTGNLRNWTQFLALRMDSAAQNEIRQYANALHDILTIKFPRTMALFDEGRQCADAH